MAERHVVSALVAKRAEMAGLVQEAERRLGVLQADLDHVDAVLRMFDPDAKPEAIGAKPPRKPSGSPTVPNLSRKVLDVLRTAGKPLIASEIARAVLENGGVETDATTLKTTTRKVGKLLDHHRRRGVVFSSDVGGRSLVWFVATETAHSAATTDSPSRRR
ncbi:hypothetical protein GAY28_00380 [Azospirillum brasilense]|nr:hypothetical protein [Azospirillum brasilense]